MSKRIYILHKNLMYVSDFIAHKLLRHCSGKQKLKHLLYRSVIDIIITKSKQKYRQNKMMHGKNKAQYSMVWPWSCWASMLLSVVTVMEENCCTTIWHVLAQCCWGFKSIFWCIPWDFDLAVYNLQRKAELIKEWINWNNFVLVRDSLYFLDLHK